MRMSQRAAAISGLAALTITLAATAAAGVIGIVFGGYGLTRKRAS
jgi:hypothetical protein